MSHQLTLGPPFEAHGKGPAPAVVLRSEMNECEKCGSVGVGLCDCVERADEFEENWREFREFRAEKAEEAEKQILRQASKIIKMKKDMAKMKKEMEEMEEMKKGILEFKEFLQDGDYRDEWNNSLADYLR